MKCTETGDN